MTVSGAFQFDLPLMQVDCAHRRNCDPEDCFSRYSNRFQPFLFSSPTHVVLPLLPLGRFLGRTGIAAYGARPAHRFAAGKLLAKRSPARPNLEAPRQHDRRQGRAQLNAASDATILINRLSGRLVWKRFATLPRSWVSNSSPYRRRSTRWARPLDQQKREGDFDDIYWSRAAHSVSIQFPAAGPVVSPGRHTFPSSKRPTRTHASTPVPDPRRPRCLTC